MSSITGAATDVRDGHERENGTDVGDVEIGATTRTTLFVSTIVAVVAIVSMALLTRWAYATATGSTDLKSADVDPVFETRDRLVWLAVGVVAAGLGLFFAARRPVAQRLLTSWPVLVLTVFAGAGIALSAAWGDPSLGLGPGNLLLALVVLPVLVLALSPVGRRLDTFVLPAVIVVALALYLPALIQTPQSLYDPLHGARAIDEMLGPAAGNYPMADYIAQYGGILGIPLAPLRPLLVNHIEYGVTAYLSVLSMLTVAALCVAAAVMLPAGRRALGVLVVVPVLLMKPSAPGQLQPVGVQRLFASIPDRSLLCVLVGLLLILLVARRGGDRWWVAAGAVAGLAALNNVESGAPAVAAMLVVLIALRPGWRMALAALGGLVGAVLGYIVLVLLTSGAFHISYWVAFAVEFADGFASLAMPGYGPQVLMLFLLGAAAASAFPAVWLGDEQVRTAAVGGLFFGAWGLAMFPYYVGRSSTMGQLQFFLIPGTICAVWLLVAAHQVFRSPSAPRLAYAALLCCLPAALFVTAVLKAPAPEYTAKRLTGEFLPKSKFRSTAWKPTPVLSQDRADEIKRFSESLPGPVGLYFTSGNVASLRTGLPNISLLAVPEELAARPWSQDPTDTGNAAFRRMQCTALQESSINTVIAEDFLAPSLETCAGFTRGATRDGLVVFERQPRDAQPDGS